MQLQGAAKAAVFLLSLPEEQAVAILRQLDGAELQQLRGAVDRLDPVKTDALEQIYSEFAEAFRSGLTSVRGSSTYLRNLVSKARGEEEALRLFSVDGRPAALAAPRPLGALDGVDPQLLGATLAKEHPQIAAAVLAHLEGVIAAEAIATMEVEQQSEIVRRITRLGSVSPAALADLEQVLGGLGLAAAPPQGIDGNDVAAKILNEMGTAADPLLDRLADTAPDEATAVRRAMFTFESLLEADKRGLQALMREVQSETLLAALKTASEPLKEKLFGCMSGRAAEMLQEELGLMPPMRLAEVEAAQEQVVEVAMRLLKEGKLTIAGRGEEMV